MFKILSLNRYNQLKKSVKAEVDLKDQIQNLTQELKNAKKENEDERYAWLVRKSEYTSSLEKKVAALQKVLDTQQSNEKEISTNLIELSKKCGVLELEIEKLELENRKLKSSKGGLKSSVTRLQKQIEKLKEPKYRITHLPEQVAQKQKMHVTSRKTRGSVRHVLREKEALRCKN